MYAPITAHLYPVILAGGVGSRLWPRSRKSTPKQFLDLLGDGRSMLQHAYDRVEPLVSPSQMLVITNAEYVSDVAAQLPDLPAENIIAEPVARGSAAAIGLAAIHLARRDPDAIMAVLTADHLMRRPETLRQVLVAAAELAQRGELVTLGIRPSHPETGYGYIEMGETLGVFNHMPAQRVNRFLEKPDLATAQAFVDAGNYAWNSGMFIWRVDTILAEFEQQMPPLHHTLQGLRPALGTDAEADAFAQFWMPLTDHSTIDYGVMEGAKSVAVFPADLGWDDIGSWAALLAILEKNTDGNAAQARHVQVDSRNNLIFSAERLIAAVGLEDMIIVDTPDAVLVMPAERAQDVKKVISQLREQGLAHYLD
ncbi:MAG: mannose-1-phosphate guanylyltransferase [Caldilineales bacterium]|nr:mannose-1-phosphate guanylyltransferase [Caldilineales bacterium]